MFCTGISRGVVWYFAQFSFGTWHNVCQLRISVRVTAAQKLVYILQLQPGWPPLPPTCLTSQTRGLLVHNRAVIALLCTSSYTK